MKSLSYASHRAGELADVCRIINSCSEPSLFCLGFLRAYLEYVGWTLEKLKDLSSYLQSNVKLWPRDLRGELTVLDTLIVRLS